VAQLEAMPVIEVHDSIMFDVPEHEVEELEALIHESIAKIPNQIKVLFGYEMVVPFDVEIKVGPSWGEMKKL